MRTPDFISKKRQKLAQDLVIWQQREYGLITGALLAPSPEEAERTRKRAEFCKQEANRVKKELNSLSGRTPRQILAGWK